MYRLILFSLIIVLAGGCAGSASHKVMTSHEQNDVNLDCTGIDTEISRAQDVIDGVNADKDDINGADIIDAVLWFPFNLIAKSSNYEQALKAADQRIETLTSLKVEKGC